MERQSKYSKIKAGKSYCVKNSINYIVLNITIYRII